MSENEICRNVKLYYNTFCCIFRVDRIHSDKEKARKKVIFVCVCVCVRACVRAWCGVVWCHVDVYGVYILSAIVHGCMHVCSVVCACLLCVCVLCVHVCGVCMCVFVCRWWDQKGMFIVTNCIE